VSSGCPSVARHVLVCEGQIEGRNLAHAQQSRDFRGYPTLNQHPCNYKLQIEIYTVTRSAQVANGASSNGASSNGPVSVAATRVSSTALSTSARSVRKSFYADGVAAEYHSGIPSNLPIGSGQSIPLWYATERHRHDLAPDIAFTPFVRFFVARASVSCSSAARPPSLAHRNRLTHRPSRSELSGQLPSVASRRGRDFLSPRPDDDLATEL
jgi:hypothetical protein